MKKLAKSDLKIIRAYLAEPPSFQPLFKDLTAGKYFAAVCNGMIKVCPTLPEDPIKSYLSFADGRHYYLTEIQQDCPKAFKDWFHEYAYAGGHPFEIMYSNSSSHNIHLWVKTCDDFKGFYMELAGHLSSMNFVNMLKIYQGMRQAGVPFELRYHEEIKKKLR